MRDESRKIKKSTPYSRFLCDASLKICSWLPPGTSWSETCTSGCVGAGVNRSNSAYTPVGACAELPQPAYSGQNQRVIPVQNQPTILVQWRPVIPIRSSPLIPVGYRHARSYHINLE